MRGVARRDAGGQQYLNATIVSNLLKELNVPGERATGERFARPQVSALPNAGVALEPA